MIATAPVDIITLEPSPSKKAAALLDKVSLDTPNSKVVAVIDDKRLSHSPASSTSEVDPAEDELSPLRKKFVGEVDLPESEYKPPTGHCSYLTLTQGEEPLLKESKRRFVLFPIQYHEVISC
jgi:ribonucleoside-diphosphate reductase subunit M2